MIYETKEEAVAAGCNPERLVRVTSIEGNSVTESYFDMGQDLADRMAEARAAWKELEEAGTPYWCVHKDRSVTHPAAYWQDDQLSGVHRKHGVRCRDCGGYIQEG